MRRRREPEPAPMMDYWARRHADVAGPDIARQHAVSRALEHERQAGRTKRSRGPRSVWSLDRQRIAEIGKLIRARHDGPCDTDDAELYLQAALPHFVRQYGEADGLRVAVDGWASLLLPTLSRARVLAMVDEAEASEPRCAKADTIAAMLSVVLTERSNLGLRTIGAADRTRAQREMDRKAQNAEYQRAKRMRNGATPRTKSKAATKPWLTLGISRSTYFARQKARNAEPDVLPANGPWTVSSAVVRSTYKPMTDQSDLSGRSDQGPARTDRLSRSVGAGGHSPRAKTRAAPLGHAVPLPLPVEGVSEHSDLFDGMDRPTEFQRLGDVLAYAGGTMPPELARAVRQAQRVRLMTQDAVARQIGISRPQLANALKGRFGLSRSAAANLVQWLNAA